MDASPDYVGLIGQYVYNGWLMEFPTLHALSAHVGGSPIFNKWAGIDRARTDGSIKRRLVMDSRRSGVTGASRKSYRSVLPRQTDLVADVLTLLNRKQAAQHVVMLVCDAEDAFWQIRLHPDERKYYCGVVENPDGTCRYFCYARTPQGSRGAPLSWAVLFGLFRGARSRLRATRSFRSRCGCMYTSTTRS